MDEKKSLTTRKRDQNLLRLLPQESFIKTDLIEKRLNP